MQFLRLLPLLLVLAMSRAFATASVLQEKPYAIATGSSTTVTSTALAAAATVGSTIEVWLINCSGTTTNPTSVVDSASQSYTFRASALDGNGGCALWLYTFSNNASATTLTVTATWAASVPDRGIWVKEIGGVSSSSYQTSTIRYVSTAPGTGTDAVSSGNVTPSSQPALLSSVVASDGNTNSTATGTGFTAGTTGTGFPFFPGRSESKRLTSTSAVPATYTDSTNGGTYLYLVGAAVYSEATASCTHSGYTSAGAIATPSGSSGSYLGKSGAFVTPDCSSVNYWQPAVGNFGVN